MNPFKYQRNLKADIKGSVKALIVANFKALNEQLLPFDKAVYDKLKPRRLKPYGKKERKKTKNPL